MALFLDLLVEKHCLNLSTLGSITMVASPSHSEDDYFVAPVLSMS